MSVTRVYKCKGSLASIYYPPFLGWADLYGYHHRQENGEERLLCAPARFIRSRSITIEVSMRTSSTRVISMVTCSPRIGSVRDYTLCTPCFNSYVRSLIIHSYYMPWRIVCGGKYYMRTKYPLPSPFLSLVHGINSPATASPVGSAPRPAKRSRLAFARTQRRIRVMRLWTARCGMLHEVPCS